MINKYKTYNCKILKISDEGSNSKDFSLSLPYKDFNFAAGQYVMVSVPGFGEAPISISSDMNEKKFFQLTIRKAGTLTSELHKKKKNDILGIRGPYGRSFPVELGKDKTILIVAGGCGIEPVRPLILDAVKNPNKYKKVYIFYGTKNEDAMIYAQEYDKWRKVCDFNLTLDNPKSKKYRQGVVTKLFDVKKVSNEAIAYVCGPPVMYKFVIDKMIKQGFKPENIFMSLERHMDCGQGVCQHCAIGPYYVCKDGPVFSYEELKNLKTWLKPI
jgi:NAD(P)H-flavin reductase